MSWLLEADTQRTALITADGTSISYTQLTEWVSGVVEHLLEAGVKPHQAQPIALVASSELLPILGILALAELCVPALLLHPRWTETDCHAAVLNAGANWLELPSSLPKSGTGNLSELTQPERRDPEVALAILHTSGSSGGPKAAVLSQRAFIASATASAENLGWFDADRWLLSLPLAHVGGLSILLRCVLARRTLVIAPSAGLRPKELHALVEQHRVTLLSLVPTQLTRLLALQLPCPEYLRAMLLGGAPAPDALLRQAADAGYPVLTTYGLTECCSQVTTQELGSINRGQLGCGKPLAGYEVELRQTQIWVRSPALLSAYLQDGQPRPALDGDGFFQTNDIGHWDDFGNLHVQGRSDAVIITGGENVHPEEIESVLLQHPQILAASVFGMPHSEWGQQLAVAIQGSIQPPELRAFVSAQLAGFRRPRQVVWLDSLPTTASGKTSRRLTAQIAQNRCRPLFSEEN